MDQEHLTNAQARAKAEFVVAAFEEMAPRFSAPVDYALVPIPLWGVRDHSYELIWEELCDLFEEAGLAEGFWPAGSIDPDDPRIGKQQPPVYRLVVDPARTREFLVCRPLPKSLTSGRVLWVWAELFSVYWTFADGLHLPTNELDCEVGESFADQLNKLETLGFVRQIDQIFEWHLQFHKARKSGSYWGRLLDRYDALTWPAV